MTINTSPGSGAALRGGTDQAASAAPPRAAPAATAPRRWAALWVLAAADFVVILDSSIVNVALPSIGRALHLPAGGLSWVINAYVLMFGGFLLLGGRTADLFGRRRVFMTSLAAFSLASLAGGLSPSGAALVGARAVQGLAAAFLAPSALSIVTGMFTDGPERNKAMGIWGSVAGSGAAAGVLLGGVLTTLLNWRWVLFVNVPIGIACACVAPALIPASPGTGRRGGTDIAGAASVTAGLGAVVYALIGAGRVGWASARTIGLLAAAAVALGAFIVIERRTAKPLVPFSVFRMRSLRQANAIMLLVGAAVLSLFFVLSLYMQEVLGYSALRTGIAQLPLAVATVVAAGLASRLLTRLGVTATLGLGLALMAGGFCWFAMVGVTASFLGAILGPSLLVAAGLGLAFVALTVGAVAGVADRDSGLASGLINSSQQIGGALGLAVAATVAAARTAAVLRSGSGLTAAAALTRGFQWAFGTGAGFLALALVVLLATSLRKSPR